MEIVEQVCRPEVIQIKDGSRGEDKMYLMKQSAMPKRILEWQADHPTLTWAFWILVWAFVFYLLFRPVALGSS